LGEVEHADVLTKNAMAESGGGIRGRLVLALAWLVRARPLPLGRSRRPLVHGALREPEGSGMSSLEDRIEAVEQKAREDRIEREKAGKPRGLSTRRPWPEPALAPLMVLHYLIA
jgi:hypothetical protein